MYTNEKGVKLDISRAKEIAAGGEGRILEHPGNKSRVVKIYHSVRKNAFAAHLKLLATLPPCFIKPIEIYYDANKNVVGFDMDYVNLSDYWLFNNLFNKGFCNSNSITEDFKIILLTKMKNALIELHAMGMQVGDLNQYNLFFSKKGELLFADVDSFQSSHNVHSGVLLDEIRDYTTQDINVQTDSYAFDVLCFWSTTFCHPYKWVSPGNTETLEQRVRNGRSILSRITGIKIPPLYVPPVGDILKQFEEIFKGRRYMIEFRGAMATVNAVVKQQVSSTAMTIREIQTDVLEVHACRTYITVHVGKQGWFVIETKSLGVTRTLSKIYGIGTEAVYPCLTGEGAYMGLKQVTLSNGTVIKFNDPSFYYHNGSLSVLDYTTDALYNFDLDSGGMVGVSWGVTQVFAKSIIFRTVPIQNFGSATYLNIPYNKAYKMVKLKNKGIKDAFFNKDYFVGEYKLKTKTIYRLQHTQYANEIDLDYLPHFAVKKINDPRKPYDLVFIPDNGVIHIYKDFQVISSLPVSNCTQDSKLYSTDAGLLMLENKTLYLLNTKQ